MKQEFIQNQDWEKLDSKTAGDVIAQISPLIKPVCFDADHVTVRRRELAFYPDHQLVEITDFSRTPNIQKYAVCGPGTAEVLNGGNDVIFKLNTIVPLCLNAESVIDYVAFFFAYVQGDHGTFQIVNSTEDIDWRDDPPPQARRVLQDMIEPMRLLEQEKQTYVLGGYVLYRQDLFSTKIKVTKNGEITPYNEEIVIEDIPVVETLAGL